jgi:hypothetical protein
VLAGVELAQNCQELSSSVLGGSQSAVALTDNLVAFRHHALTPTSIIEPPTSFFVHTYIHLYKRIHIATGEGSTSTGHPLHIHVMTRDTPANGFNVDPQVLSALWEAQAPSFPHLPPDAPPELLKNTVDVRDPQRVYSIYRASRRYNFQLLVER